MTCYPYHMWVESGIGYFQGGASMTTLSAFPMFCDYLLLIKLKLFNLFFLLTKNNKENKNYRNILKFVHLKIGSLVDGRHYQFGKLGRLFFQINF